mmetsp:Transcript_35383/g.34417  ORF Transcript_35383/g.34417 Transcript_35383/m.34417 type:complete len:138 (+) Transcript_35383:1388-1801(+)
MGLFLTYYVCTFLFQFFTVGSMYASITIFFDTVFISALSSDSSTSKINEWMASGGMALVFDYTYIALILMCIILSLTTPVDRAVPVFIFLMVVFGILLTISFVGIIYYLAVTGLFDYSAQCVQENPNNYTTRCTEVF